MVEEGEGKMKLRRICILVAGVLGAGGLHAAERLTIPQIQGTTEAVV